MRLYELQQFDVEKQLQDVANGIEDQANSPDQAGGNPPPAPGMPGPDMMPPDPAGQPPAPGAGGPAAPPMPDPTADLHPVSSDLIAAVRGLPYVTEYKHKDDSPINPMRLLNMSIGDLKSARNTVKTKINMETLNDQVGLYDSPDMNFYRDLINFIDTVTQNKKASGESAVPDTSQPDVKAKKQPAPKTQAGAV